MEVWKFPLQSGNTSVEMPRGAVPLAVDVQDRQPQLWCLVSPENPPCQRRVAVVGTGHPFDPGDMVFVGTFMLSGGALVFHVFVDRPEES